MNAKGVSPIAGDARALTPESAGPRFGPLAPTLAMLAAAAYVFVMRQPRILAVPTFWAEDGPVYFKSAVEQGLGSLLQPYNGQLFVFQRIVAGLSALLPVSVQPTVYATVAVATAVLSCSIVLSSRWRWQVPLNVRFVCLLALLCSPAVDPGLFGTLTNTHWWLAIGLVLLGMLHDPLSRRLKIGELALAAVTALSGLAAIYALPSLGVRAFRNRSRHSLALAGVALAGTLVQVGYVVFASTRPGDLKDVVTHPATTIAVLVRRVFGCAALGDPSLQVWWQHRIPDVWAGMTAGLLIVALAVIWLLARRLEIGAVVLALAGGALMAMWTLWTWPDPTRALWDGGWRYFLVPVAMLYVSMVLWWPAGRMGRVVAGLACVLLATGIFTGYRVDGLAASDWSTFSACMEKRATTCTVVIPPGWTLEVDPGGR